MEYKIPFGKKIQKITTDKQIVILKKEESINVDINFDLNHFRNFTQHIESLLIIVNDHSRITPTIKILDIIFNEIKKISHIRFIIATGTHRMPSQDEQKKIFGKYFDSISKKIIIHKGNSEDVDFYGTTNWGTNVYFNSILKKYKNVLAIGGVEPHYFAGFSGGAKSFFPGIAHYNSIEQNHKLALKSTSVILNTKSNPVSLDIWEAVSFLKNKIYSIQCVNDKDGNLRYVAQGNLKESFKKAVSFAKSEFSIKVNEKADILVTVVNSPFDKNFYQAHKGLENTKSILKKGGIMILVAECSEGIGKDNFYKLLHNKTLLTENNYKLGYHKTAKILEFLSYHKLFFVTDIKPSLFYGINIEIFNSIQKAFDKAIKILPNAKNICIVHNSAVTVPIV